MQNKDSSLFIKKTFADLKIGLHELTIQNVLDLNKLEPYGQSNEEPVFLTTNVFIRRSKAVGSCKNHLSCFITDGAYGSSAIMFKVDNISQYFNYEGVVFAFFHARISTFQMKTTMKMYLSSLFPSTHFTNKEPHNLKNSEFIEEIFQHSQTSGNRISSVGSFISENLNSYNQDIIKENTRRFFHKINIEKKEKNKS